LIIHEAPFERSEISMFDERRSVDQDERVAGAKRRAS
jgi:hypothetical protein